MEIWARLRWKQGTWGSAYLKWRSESNDTCQIGDGWSTRRRPIALAIVLIVEQEHVGHASVDVILHVAGDIESTHGSCVGACYLESIGSL